MYFGDAKWFDDTFLPFKSASDLSATSLTTSE